MSGGDYALAQWIPSPNFWPGGDGNWYVVIHATASGGPQTGYQLAKSAEFTDGKTASVHYINDVDGTVYQIVREADSAWGNCCVDGNSPFDPNYNWNRKTISIENVKHSSDNSEPLTPAQYQSLVALVRDICKRQGIPMQQGTPTTKGILYHHNLMPIQKARCPGTFPYDTFFADLSQGGRIVSLVTNSKGENADIALPSQFEPNETEFACGFFTAALCKYAGLPGKGPTAPPEQVDVWADVQYDAQYGNHGPGKLGGVSIPDMWRLFKTAGNLHFWDIAAITPTSTQATDIASVRAALNAGYLVAITVDEASVHDLDLAGVNPYSWNPLPGQATHVFLLTGAGVPGSFLLAEDTANIVGPLQGANTVRPGPRRYDEKSIAMHWASVVQLVGPDASHPWMKPIPSADPTTWPQGFNCQNFGGIQPMNWPSQGMQQQAMDTWLISAKFLQAAFGDTAPYTTGIALAWQDRYKQGKNYGPPVCTEIVASGVRAEWDGSIHWFDKDGPLS